MLRHPNNTSIGGHGPFFVGQPILFLARNVVGMSSAFLFFQKVIAKVSHSHDDLEKVSKTMMQSLIFWHDAKNQAFEILA